MTNNKTKRMVLWCLADLPHVLKALLVLAIVVQLWITAFHALRTPPSAQAQSAITLHTAADLTGDGSTHALGSGTGRWVQIIPLATNGAAVRIGDSNVSASQGSPVAAGGSFYLARANDVNLWYSLSSIYYYAANGDKISVTWGN